MIERAEPRARAVLVTDTGTLTVHSPYHPQSGGTLTWQPLTGEPIVEIPDRSSSYVHMLSAFAATVLYGVPTPTGSAQAVNAMQLLDEAHATAGLPRRHRTSGDSE